MKNLDYLITPEIKSAYIPCKSCSNVMTRECFDACMPEMRFRYYRHRPGTDIATLPRFPLEEVLSEPDAQKRLLAVCIYLTCLVDYIQHPDEYERNRRLYQEGNDDGQHPDSERSSQDHQDL